MNLWREAARHEDTPSGFGIPAAEGFWAGTFRPGALYRIADFVVVPSRYEPFGMVALEAAVCGARVIASNVGGLAEIIPETNGAIIPVPAANVDALTRAIAKVLANTAIPINLAQIGQLRAKYSWGTVAAKISEVMKELSR